MGKLISHSVVGERISTTEWSFKSERERGGWQRWVRQLNGDDWRHVVQKPGMQKDASASIIQHDQDDCLPLLSLLSVFI